MRNRFRWIVAMGLTSFGVGAQTNVPAHVPCPGCDEPAMSAAALRATPDTHLGAWSVHVYSLPTGIIRHYEVACMGGGGLVQPLGDDAATVHTETTTASCGGTRVATGIPVDDNVQRGFDALRRQYVDTGGLMSASLSPNASDVPGIGEISAYDVASSPTARAEVAYHLVQWVDTHWHPWAEFWGASHANAFFGFTDGVKLTIRLTFKDGTTCTFSWQSSDEQMTFEPASAATPTGQPIPDAEEGFDNGEWRSIGYDGGLDDLHRFIEHIDRMNIPVYRADGTRIPRGGSATAGAIRKITCQREGGRTVCRVHAT